MYINVNFVFRLIPSHKALLKQQTNSSEIIREKTLSFKNHPKPANSLPQNTFKRLSGWLSEKN